MNDDLPVWQQPESRRLEFKEIFPSGNQIAKTVIAFANGAGGRIVFGIRDNPREISGIPDEGIFHLEERIARHIADQCAPLIIPDIFTSRHVRAGICWWSRCFPDSRNLII